MSTRQRPAASGVGRFSLWCVLLPAALAPAPLIAGPGGNGGPPVRIQVPGTINLEPILAQDILTGNTTRAAGTSRRTLDLGDPTLDAGIDQVPQASLGINPEVIRRVMGLWRIRIPPNAPGIPAVAIDYQLTSPLGTRGALGLASQPATTVDVDVIDLGYRITRRGQGQGFGRGRRDIEGDLEFRFQTTSLRAAGRYNGELLITVNLL